MKEHFFGSVHGLRVLLAVLAGIMLGVALLVGVGCTATPTPIFDSPVILPVQDEVQAQEVYARKHVLTFEYGSVHISSTSEYGPAIFSVRLRNAAGQIEPQYSQTITTDVALPSEPVSGVVGVVYYTLNVTSTVPLTEEVKLTHYALDDDAYCYDGQESFYCLELTYPCQKYAVSGDGWCETGVITSTEQVYRVYLPYLGKSQKAD